MLSLYCATARGVVACLYIVAFLHPSVSLVVLYHHSLHRSGSSGGSLRFTHSLYGSGPSGSNTVTYYLSSFSTESTHFSGLVPSCLMALTDRCTSFLCASYRVSESGGMTPTYTLRRTEQKKQKLIPHLSVIPFPSSWLFSYRSTEHLSSPATQLWWYRHFLPLISLPILYSYIHTYPFENEIRCRGGRVLAAIL
jgi:hypothetical protein